MFPQYIDCSRNLQDYSSQLKIPMANQLRKKSAEIYCNQTCVFELRFFYKSYIIMMAKIIKSEVPVVFRLQEDGDQLMIGSQVGNSMNLVKGELYKRFPSLWRRYVTAEERELLLSLGVSCSNQSMLVKANEIEVVMKNSGINDEATSEIEDEANDVTASETEGEATEEEPSASMPKNVDKFIHSHGTVNIEGVFENILTELQSLKSESEKQRKEIINLKHGEACQCLQEQVVSLRKENQKLAEENQQLHERNNDLSYLMSNLNTKVKDFENEKQSLVTALKILHEDYGKEIANRSCSGAQVNTNLCNQEAGQNNAWRKSSGNTQPELQSKSFEDSNNYSVLQIEGDDDDLKIITEGTGTSDQMALKPSLGKRPNKSKSGGNGRPTSKEPAESTRVSKTEDKKLIFIAGDSIVQHVHGWELSNAKQRLAVKSFSGSKAGDMADYLKPLIRKTPAEIIVHVGTNDIKDDSKSAEVVAAEILNLGNQIKDKLPDTNVTISGITVRKDKASVNNKINNVNVILKRVCDHNKWSYIDNSNIDNTCLNRRGLHLNRKGSSIISKNFSNYLNA